MSRSVFRRLGFIINQTSWAMKRRIQGVITEQGFLITPEQWILINLLYEKPGSSQTRLANLMFKEKASITRMTKCLNKQGLIEVGSDRKDRRKHLVHLSAKGQKLQKELEPVILKEYHHMVDSIPETKKEILMEVLTEICDVAEK